jgi:hypothetical protein
MKNEEMYTVLSKQMDENHAHIKELLEGIQNQVTKANGRTGKIEMQIWELQKNETRHIIDCPQAKEIKELREENQEIRIIKKYPKIALGVLLGIVLLGLVAIYEGYVKLDDTLNLVRAKQSTIIDEIKKDIIKDNSLKK